MHSDVAGEVDVIEGDSVALPRNIDDFLRFEGAGAARAHGGTDGGTPTRENKTGVASDAGEEGRAGGVLYGLSE